MQLPSKMSPSKLFKFKHDPQSSSSKKSKFKSKEPSDNISYDFAAKLLSNLNLLRRDKQFCDVEVKLGNKVFHVSYTNIWFFDL